LFSLLSEYFVLSQVKHIHAWAHWSHCVGMTVLCYGRRTHMPGCLNWTAVISTSIKTGRWTVLALAALVQSSRLILAMVCSRSFVGRLDIIVSKQDWWTVTKFN